MSLAGLIVLAVCWSGLVWAGGAYLSRGLSPSKAQAVWRSTALLVAAPFALSLVVPSLPARVSAPMAELPVFEPLVAAPLGEEFPAAQPSALEWPDIGPVLVAVLIAGWAVRFGLWLASQVRLQRLKAQAFPVRRPLRHWAEALNLARVPEVRIIANGAPFLAGLRRPIIFVPAPLAGREGDTEILVHELVHLKRGDLVLRPLERLVADVFWFSPFAWAIRSELDTWREAAVDETAAELTGDRIAYARALTRAARFARPVQPLPVAALILKKEGTLKMRLNLLLTDETRPRRAGLAAVILLACAAPLAIAQGVLIRGPAATIVAAPAAAAPPEALYSHPVLDKGKVTSAFGMRKHPITGEMKLHRGTDLAEKKGVSVYTPASGTVTRAEYDKGYGNLVEVATGGTTLRFGQLDTLGVKAGDPVLAGAVIGTLGESGQATGPHLHFEVWRAGEPVDPQAEEGLVLAGELKVAAGAAPLPPLAPAAPVAKTAATPKVAPTPPTPVTAATPVVAPTPPPPITSAVPAVAPAPSAPVTEAVPSAAPVAAPPAPDPALGRPAPGQPD